MWLLTVLACDGGTTYNGIGMEDYFPMEGERSATYKNDDDTVPYLLLMEKQSQSTTVGDRDVWTFEYSDDTTASLVGGVQWSNSSGSVQIHGWAGADGVYSTFDPAIDVTDDDGRMLTGDAITTTTGGVTWTSTFVGVESCPVEWGLDWEGCVHISLTDGGAAPSAADDPSRPFFVGDYWVIQRYMIAWMHIRGYDANWNLADYVYNGE